MISTFDLTLLGSLVSAGGLVFLRQGKWPHADFGRFTGGKPDVLKEGYLFGPWADVLFHLVFVSTCWATTVFRIHQAAERSTARSLVDNSPRLNT